jgi:hypothetical protein
LGRVRAGRVVSGGWGGGPELGGAAGGEGPLAAGFAGRGEVGEGLLETFDGLVAVAEIAELGAGQPGG